MPMAGSGSANEAALFALQPYQQHKTPDRHQQYHCCKQQAQSQSEQYGRFNFCLHDWSQPADFTCPQRVRAVRVIQPLDA